MKTPTLLLILLSVALALAQPPKKSVAVYMAGKEPAAVKGAYKVLGSELAKTITKSKEYTAADRSEAGRKIVASEQIFQRSGAVDPKQIKRLGKQLGVQIMCIAEVTQVMNSHYLEARLVDVETAEILAVASQMGNMSKASDIERTIQAVAQELVTGEAKLVYYSFKELDFKPDEAIADYTNAIRQEPSVAEYYVKRAYAYLNKEDNDRAIADYNEVIRLDPKDYDAYFCRGLAYSNKGDYDQAISDYTQAIRLNPDDAGAYNNRGNAYSAKGDHDQAISDHTKAIQLDPNDNDAYYNRGAAYDAKGEYDLAISDYTQAIRLNPDDGDAYYNRGAAYADKGNYDQAISDYTQAIRLNPDNMYAYNNRSVAYYTKKEYGKALTDCEAALRINPDYSGAQENLKLIKEAMRQ